MWLYLKTGFYSIVYKAPCKADELLVRTRSKADIDKLRNLLKEKYQVDAEVIDTPKADYAYRMRVPRKTFAAFMADIALELDYDNFKNTIHANDYQRHDAYLKCWETMYAWQRDLKRGTKNE